ncbi:MAG: class I SAM-dependent methyltransferase [Bacteroidota bacterium]
MTERRLRISAKPVRRNKQANPKTKVFKKFDPLMTQCGLCGSRKIRFFYRDYKGLQIYKCTDCGIEFMNPQYSDGHLEQYYSTFTVDEPEWDEPLIYCHNYYLSLVERYSQKGSILDIGSGNGYFLVAAKQRGWSPTGYDVDRKTVASVSKRIGVRILSGDFTKLKWEPDSFDAVYMHQVIEHLKSPMPYFRVIQRVLRKNGVLFVAQPNIHALAARVKYGLEKLGLRKKNIGAYYGTDGHLWYYTPKTMRRLLESLGFEVLYMRSGHKARAHQSALKRFLLRNLVEVVPWKSTFLVVARKV